MQHRLVEARLAARIERHDYRADHDEHGRKRQVRSRGDSRQAIEQAQKAAGRQRHRKHVERGAPELAEVLEEREGKRDHHHRERRDDAEERTPAQVVDEQARQRRADGRGKADDEADHAHGGAALLTREHEQDHRGHHGHDHARARGLKHAPRQQERERRGKRGEQAARPEDAHARDEQLAHGEAPHEVGRQRDDARLDERVAAREPLRGGALDAQVRHDRGQGRREQREVEHGEQCARKHHRHHDQVFS